MKTDCTVIKDLLPLYYDGVCSEESAEIIKKHLSECTSCDEYYTMLCDADKIASSAFDERKELEKAKSFKEIKKKLRKKQFIISAVCILSLVIISFVVTTVLKNNRGIVPYNDNNISVHTIDDDLVGRLKGSVWEQVRVKTVEIENNGITETYIVFCLIHNEWDNLISNNNSFTEFTLAYADKGAEEIDKVYYYTGDFEGLEELNDEEITHALEGSVLLWSK